MDDIRTASPFAALRVKYASQASGAPTTVVTPDVGSDSLTLAVQMCPSNARGSGVPEHTRSCTSCIKVHWSGKCGPELREQALHVCLVPPRAGRLAGMVGPGR